jgi:hypothetical protein
MFANIAKFQAMTRRRAVPSPFAPAHANDNRIDAGGAAARRTRRPVLACRWRPIIGGGLECRWVIAFADGTAIEEPDGRRLIRRISQLLGAVPAME